MLESSGRSDGVAPPSGQQRPVSALRRASSHRSASTQARIPLVLFCGALGSDYTFLSIARAGGGSAETTPFMREEASEHRARKLPVAPRGLWLPFDHSAREL